jgi:hypothetical protein
MTPYNEQQCVALRDRAILTEREVRLLDTIESALDHIVARARWEEHCILCDVCDDPNTDEDPTLENCCLHGRTLFLNNRATVEYPRENEAMPSCRELLDKVKENLDKARENEPIRQAETGEQPRKESA